MQQVPDLIPLLNRSGCKLSKSHQRIAAYLQAHYDKVVFMTARTVAEAVSTSESTVVRFASALGYEGYPEMQRRLQELVFHHMTANERMEMSAEMEPKDVLPTVLRTDVQNLHNTLSQLDQEAFQQAVRMILSARSIYVIGLRSAAPLAQFLGYYLRFIFDQVHLVPDGGADVFEEILQMQEADVLIGISFPRYSTRTLEAMRFARHKGAQVIAITDGPMSPLCSISHAVLTARTDMSSFVDSLAAPMSLINALLAALGLQRKEALSDHFRQLEELWDSQQIYLAEGKAPSASSASAKRPGIAKAPLPSAASPDGNRRDASSASPDENCHDASSASPDGNRRDAFPASPDENRRDASPASADKSRCDASPASALCGVPSLASDTEGRTDASYMNKQSEREAKPHE